MDLPFETERYPLAARMRPRTLQEFVGQEHILAPGRLLRRAVEADQISSLVLSGPPGTGKTTLAQVVAQHTRSQFLSVNAVLSGVKDLRLAIGKAKSFREQVNRRTILFVDEVHRWNRSQQDALLPWVEEGTIILIGATTENPFFEVNRALLSRSRVFLLKPLEPRHLHRVLDNALSDPERGYGNYAVTITDEAREHLVATAAGDARTLLNAVELAIETSHDSFPPPPGSAIHVDLATAEDSIQRRAVLYDKDGDYHFDTISALIKSIRGSDPDAALYWLARMVTAGEDPHYIFRRLLVQASEDIGLAEPQAISVVTGCAQAFDRVGLPEGQFHLAQAVLYLANCEKSNSTLAYFDALKSLDDISDTEVPHHLRDANRDGAALGHGKGYLYPHAYRDHWVAQQYLPGGLQGRQFYQPGVLGWEGARAEQLGERRRLQIAAIQEQSDTAWVVAPSRGGDSDWTYRAEGELYEHLRRLRDLLVTQLQLNPEDRVLLAGDGVLVTVWEVLRRAHGGLTAVWGPPETLEIIRYSLTIDSSRLEAPELVPCTTTLHPDHPSDDGRSYHGGPFDRVLVRTFAAEDPLQTVETVLQLLASDGRAVIVDVNPMEGTRPSTVLDLAQTDREALEAAERSVVPQQNAAWNEVSSSVATAQVTTTTHSVITPRQISSEQVNQWLHPDSPLGAALAHSADGEALARIRAAARALQQQTVQWNRSYRLITLTRSPPAPPPGATA